MHRCVKLRLQAQPLVRKRRSADAWRQPICVQEVATCIFHQYWPGASLQERKETQVRNPKLSRYEAGQPQSMFNQLRQESQHWQKRLAVCFFITAIYKEGVVYSGAQLTW